MKPGVAKSASRSPSLKPRAEAQSPPKRSCKALCCDSGFRRSSPRSRHVQEVPTRRRKNEGSSLLQLNILPQKRRTCEAPASKKTKRGGGAWRGRCHEAPETQKRLEPQRPCGGEPGLEGSQRFRGFGLTLIGVVTPTSISPVTQTFEPLSPRP